MGFDLRRGFSHCGIGEAEGCHRYQARRFQRFHRIVPCRKHREKEMGNPLDY
ncbi:hypothetical protein ACWWJF_06910 [Symbiopectobacterium sp. Eva_TO]